MDITQERCEKQLRLVRKINGYLSSMLVHEIRELLCVVLIVTWIKFCIGTMLKLMEQQTGVVCLAWTVVQCHKIGLHLQDGEKLLQCPVFLQTVFRVSSATVP